ncbi:MAG: iron ABC transporter permease [Gammaproteobacteria bacterium]|nr:MAG: iron ABC transporter permease [Gammaproteobacteria bacterium]
MTSPRYLLFSAIFVACLSILLSFAKGSTSIALHQLVFDPIFWQLRLPRTLSAFTCGALLALAGSLMQLLLQNPLADPYALGISSGAALVTLLLMLWGVDAAWLAGGAWLGSLMTMVLIWLITRKHRFQTHTLLLAGIALACGFSAAMSCILLISPATDLHNMLFWLTGDLNNAHSPWFALLILFLGLIICVLLAPGLNLLAHGEKEAKALGLASEKYRIALYLLSSLFTATAVTLVGCIGFIGLIIPHLTRLLAGFDHRLVLPMAALLGGSLLTLADTLARSLFAPQQLPVGMVMALIGVPIFIWMLQK